MLKPFAWIALLGCCMSALCSTGDAQAAGFDRQTLRERGIDPGVAEYLANAARFTPGTHPVALTVNGRALGRVEVRITQAGELCIDRPLLDSAHMVAPPGQLDSPGVDCERFQASHPQSIVHLDPQASAVDLIVPPQALSRDRHGQSSAHYDSGGMAGVLNYDLAWSQHRFGVNAEDAWTARTELGLNAGNWVLRSHQLAGSLDGQQRVDWLDAYAQRTFEQPALVFQLGQIDLRNPLLGGMAVTGVQAFPEQALHEASDQRTIEGIAQTPARVEVRQGGRLVHATLVPAGPFALVPPALVDPLAPLEVSIIEANGKRRRLNVATPHSVGLDSPAGFTYGLGAMRDHEHSPTVLSGGWNGNLGGRLATASGALANADYQALGVGLGLLAWTDAQISTVWRQSWAGRHGHVGSQSQLRLAQRWGRNWQATVDYSRQTSGYRQLHEALNTADKSGQVAFERDQYSFSLSSQQARLGGFSFGLGQSRLADGQRLGRTHLAWSKALSKATVNVGVDWASRTGRGGRAMYLGLSVPLDGKRRLRLSHVGKGETRRTGITLREQVNDRLDYDLGLEQRAGQDGLRSRAGVSLRNGSNQMRLDYAGNGRDDRSVSANLRGAAVAHEEGITLSPYSVHDTFALLNVAALEDIEVTTPSGPVRTDGNGRAVVAQVEPYREVPVQVRSRSLPRSAELDNAIVTVQARRGTVSKVAFDVQQRRRLLLMVSHDGKPIPAGAKVTDAAGEFVTLVQHAGVVFLHDYRQGASLSVEIPGARTCILEFQPAEKLDPNRHYETLPAQCRAA